MYMHGAKTPTSNHPTRTGAHVLNLAEGALKSAVDPVQHLMATQSFGRRGGVEDVHRHGNTHVNELGGGKGKWCVTGRGYIDTSHTTSSSGSPIKTQRELPSTTAAGPAKNGRKPEQEDSVPQRRLEGKEAVFSCADYRTAGHATGSSVSQASRQESREMMCCYAMMVVRFTVAAVPLHAVCIYAC